MSTGLRRDRRQLTSARSLVSPKCLSGNISERKLAFSGCEQSLVPEGDLSRWRLRRLKNPMISRSGFRTDTEWLLRGGSWAPRKIHPCRSHAKCLQGLSDRREQLSWYFSRCPHVRGGGPDGRG